MKRFFKWVLLVAFVLLLTLGAVVWALQRWIGTDDFKDRAEREASAALGVPIALAKIDVTVWPLPAVAVEGVQIQTRPALQLARIEVRPAWRALVLGQLELATLLVRGAQLPQAGIDALQLSLQKKKQLTQAAQGPEVENAFNPQYIPRRTVLDGVTWVSAKGTRMVLDADAQLSPQGLPDDVSIKILKGHWQGTSARLQRLGKDWTLAMTVGGGTVKGAFQLQPAPGPGAEFVVNGQLQTRAVEVAALMNAPSVLSGALDADSTLSVHATNLGAVPEKLLTTSKFTMRHAVVHGIDLAKAVKTVGLSRGGETPLDTLGGQVTTHGRSLQLTNLAASSGVLSASGNVAVTPGRELSGRVSVDLAGAISVPLQVGGTLDAPEVSLARSALIGAAIGTAIMPGVGTGAGASLGDKVGQGFKKLFGK